MSNTESLPPNGQGAVTRGEERTCSSVAAEGWLWVQGKVPGATESFSRSEHQSEEPLGAVGHVTLGGGGRWAAGTEHTQDQRVRVSSLLGHNKAMGTASASPLKRGELCYPAPPGISWGLLGDRRALDGESWDQGSRSGYKPPAV